MVSKKIIPLEIAYVGKYCATFCPLLNSEWRSCQKFGELATPDCDDPDPSGYEDDAAFELRHPECVKLTKGTIVWP